MKNIVSMVINMSIYMLLRNNEGMGEGSGTDVKNILNDVSLLKTRLGVNSWMLKILLKCKRHIFQFTVSDLLFMELSYKLIYEYYYKSQIMLINVSNIENQSIF